MVDERVQTFIEEYKGAQDELEKNRYKNSAILFSKALFAVCDILTKNKLNKLPKNHSERFKMLKENFKEVYDVVDGIFDKYTDSYSRPILKETCESIKDGIKQIRDIESLPPEIQEAIG